MAKKKHRDYQNDFPSVTQAIGVLRKIGLEIWFKNNTAQFCNKKSSRGKLIGTQIHDAIQSHIDKEEVRIETQYVDEVSNALKSFMLFKKENRKIKLQRAEIALTSKKYKFNGTLDCLGKEVNRILVDWKSGECKKEETIPRIYDESKYQASAYFMMYNELNKEQLEKAYIVSLAKDRVSYNMLEMQKEELEEMFKNVFLPALQIYNYQKKGVSNGYSTRQRNTSDTERIGGSSQPSTKLPDSF